MHKFGYVKYHVPSHRSGQVALNSFEFNVIGDIFTVETNIQDFTQLLDLIKIKSYRHGFRVEQKMFGMLLRNWCFQQRDVGFLLANDYRVSCIFFKWQIKIVITENTIYIYPFTKSQSKQNRLAKIISKYIIGLIIYHSKKMQKPLTFGHRSFPRSKLVINLIL